VDHSSPGNEIQHDLGVFRALRRMYENWRIRGQIMSANVFLHLDGQWMVIDLELVAKLDKCGEADWRPGIPAQYPMPHHFGEERWKPEDDIKYMLAMLGHIQVLQDHPQSVDVMDALQSIKYSTSDGQGLSLLL
jgi:hypothetical protein